MSERKSIAEEVATILEQEGSLIRFFIAFNEIQKRSYREYELMDNQEVINDYYEAFQLLNNEMVGHCLGLRTQQTEFFKSWSPESIQNLAENQKDRVDKVIGLIRISLGQLA